MKHSLAAQISYYNEYIQRNPDWIFAGIYADEAYSGTKDDRPRFVQLIQDCKDGKGALKLPLRDGDTERDDDNYADCYFINAKAMNPRRLARKTRRWPCTLRFCLLR